MDLSERPERNLVRMVPTKKASVLAHALSGAIGAVLAEIVLFPVDTIKLRMQTALAGESVGFFGMFARVVGEHGVAGLYKGISASVLKESIHSFNYWIWHEAVFRTLSKGGDTSRTPTSMRLLLNLFAKQLNWLCTVPFEVVSSVNQLSADSPGFFATALMLYKQGGIPYFYRGLALSLVLAINPAIMNTLITSSLRLAALMKMAFGNDYEEARNHGPVIVGVVTGVAKFIATLATYPIIRAKVLQQTTVTKKQLSAFKIWREIIAAEGLGGLYRGVLAMSYKTVLWNSFMMMVKSGLGPKRMMTPPATPQVPVPRPLPFMARDPFTDIVNTEKLDEILQYVKTHSKWARDPRMNDIEGRLDEVSKDMREIKAVLQHFIATAPTPRFGDNLAGQSPAV